jgi:DNA-binding XRE family transcriptional regulator
MNIPLKTKIIVSRMSQVAIAKKIGINAPLMSNIVNGWHIPSPELRMAIAKALKCRVGDIFKDKLG